MSVSHPLLKALKEHIVALLTDPTVSPGSSRVVTDDHACLKSLCETLERVVLNGKYDFASLPLLPLANVLRETTDFKRGVLRNCVEAARKSPKVSTNEGRFRLLLRICLVKKTLAELFTVISGDLGNLYAPSNSILGDEILSQIFVSLVAQLGIQVEFKLNLENAIYLDETYLLPIYKEYVFVPSDTLGVRIAFARGTPIVIEVTRGSVAAEDDRVEVGDVIESLFGECLYKRERNKARLLVRANRGKPIKIVVLKSYLADGTIFPPLAAVLKTLKIDVTLREGARSKRVVPDCAMLSLEDKAPIKSSEYSVMYCGSVELGRSGDIAHLSLGIQHVLRTPNRCEKQAYMHVGETMVTVREATSGTMFRKENYTQISACGCREDVPQYFAYICGEVACSIAEKFTCYVFRAASKHQSMAIVEMIADGFERTGWAV